MANVIRSRKFNSTPEIIWKKIGDFKSLHTWHPAVKNCTSSQSGKVRELTLANGGHIFETLLNDGGALSYTYRIDKSPLPVKNYVATLRVRDAGQNACQVEWEATFEPAGASEEEAVTVIGGIFQGGLDNL